MKAKEDLNNRLINLQLQGIKSQLDPHFTFNTLNSIASLIYLEDRHTAYDYMRKFTQLLRCMLNDAEKIYRNLGDELEFVTHTWNSKNLDSVINSILKSISVKM
ncbi:MAG: histidine kinase [Bacteroidales bacterium]|nr:histidine kinase [Bacteroidales bacterium]